MYQNEPLWSQKFLDAAGAHLNRQQLRFLSNREATKSMTWFTFTIIVSVGLLGLSLLR